MNVSIIKLSLLLHNFSLQIVFEWFIAYGEFVFFGLCTFGECDALGFLVIDLKFPGLAVLVGDIYCFLKTFRSCRDEDYVVGVC